jgi:hypothetical protein
MLPAILRLFSSFVIVVALSASVDARAAGMTHLGQPSSVARSVLTGLPAQVPDATEGNWCVGTDFTSSIREFTDPDGRCGRSAGGGAPGPCDWTSSSPGPEITQDEHRIGKAIVEGAVDLSGLGVFTHNINGLGYLAIGDYDTARGEFEQAFVGAVLMRLLATRANHVGSSDDPAINRGVNPSGRGDNCVACTVAGIKNRAARSVALTADDVERFWGSTGKEMRFQEFNAVSYFERAGVKLSEGRVGMNTAEGNYVVFARARSDGSGHVVFGGNRRGRMWLHDYQTGRTYTPQQFAAEYTGIRPYLVEGVSQ